MTFRSVSITGISLGLLALMVSGPFLFPFHSLPLASFWNEWWAGALGLAAAMAGLIAIRGRSLALPQVLLVPVILLLALLLQFATGRLAFPQIGLLYAVYLLWAAMLMVLGRQLAQEAGSARLADVMACAIVLGALIGAEIALAQWLGVTGDATWIFPKLDRVVYANLAQGNHHGQYSWLGIASAFYLRGRLHLSRFLLWTLILLIALASVLSASRSVFVYPFVLLGAIGWLKLREPNGPAAWLLKDAALLLPLVIVLSLFASWATPQLPALLEWLGLSRSGGGGTLIAGARLFESVSTGSERLEIARSAWAAFGEHPWLGQGAGNYAWASFVAASTHLGDEVFGVGENAHNLILQLMTEFGAPVAAVVVLTLGLWVRRFLAGPWRLEQFWFATVLGIGLVHSLLEYPLWYSYFLGPTAVLLGAAEGGKSIVVAGRRAAIYMLLAGLAGGMILANLRADYSKIEMVSYAPLAGHPDRERAWRISMERLLKLHDESLLSPWALLAFTSLGEPDAQLAQARATLCERGMRFVPARSLVTRCAMQLAIVGRSADAREMAVAVLRAFPAQRAMTVDELAAGAKRFPEIVPLWQASLGRQ